MRQSLFSAVDIVLENRSGSVLVAGEIWFREGHGRQGNYYGLQLSSAYLGKNRTLKKRKGAAPPSNVSFAERSLVLGGKLFGVVGGDFAELFNGLGNCEEGVVDFLAGGVAPEAEAQTAASFRWRETDGG